MYILLASNFHNFSKIVKLNTREFLEFHDFVCIEYQHFRDMICSILRMCNVNNTGHILIITFV